MNKTEEDRIMVISWTQWRPAAVWHWHTEVACIGLA